MPYALGNVPHVLGNVPHGLGNVPHVLYLWTAHCTVRVPTLPCMYTVGYIVPQIYCTI